MGTVCRVFLSTAKSTWIFSCWISEAETTKASKAEGESTQLVRARLFPDEGDKRHTEAVLRSSLGSRTGSLCRSGGSLV